MSGAGDSNSPETMMNAKNSSCMLAIRLEFMLQTMWEKDVPVVTSSCFWNYFHRLACVATLTILVSTKKNKLRTNRHNRGQKPRLSVSYYIRLRFFFAFAGADYFFFVKTDQSTTTTKTNKVKSLPLLFPPLLSNNQKKLAVLHLFSVSDFFNLFFLWKLYQKMRLFLKNQNDLAFQKKKWIN